MKDSRFLFELDQIIQRAKQGDVVSTFNILQYIRNAMEHGKTPDQRAINFVLDAIYNLKSKKNVNKLEDNKVFKIAKILAGRQQSRSVEKYAKLKEKILVKRSQTHDYDNIDVDIHDIDKEIMRIGASVAAKVKEYKSLSSANREKMRLKKEGGPYKKAIQEVSEEENISSKSIERHYQAFKQQRKLEALNEKNKTVLLNIVDENGRYIESIEDTHYPAKKQKDD